MHSAPKGFEDWDDERDVHAFDREPCIEDKTESTKLGPFASGAVEILKHFGRSPG